jgi:hypothetical protein
MLALQVLMILLAYRMARTARSVLLGALCTLAAVLSLMNVVSMAIDWLVPYYAALWLSRPELPGVDDSPPIAQADWRRYVLVQALATAGMAFVFFISHLPSLYSSAQLYGAAFHSPGQFLRLAWDVFAELFPDFGPKALAAAGVVGLVALGVSRRHKFLTGLVVLLVTVNFLHYLLSRKLPYGRAAGHFIPVVLLGAAYLVEWTLRLFESALSKALIFGALALLSLGLAASSWDLSLENEELSEYLALARRAKLAPGASCYVSVRTETDYVFSHYRPAGWKRVDVVYPGMEVVVLHFSRDPRRAGAVVGVPKVKGYSLECYSGETRLLPGGGTVPPSAWVIWYPDLTLLGIDASEQDAYVRDSGCWALHQFARYQIKFDVYSNRQCYIFTPGEDPECPGITVVVREGLRRFGGRAVVFVPSDTRIY